jgi:hypothetical protein
MFKGYSDYDTDELADHLMESGDDFEMNNENPVKKGSQRKCLTPSHPNSILRNKAFGSPRGSPLSRFDVFCFLIFML